MNLTASQKLYSTALEYLPGGVDSPVRAFRAVGGTPIFMREGRAGHIVDEDGNQYIDLCMSWGPLLLGHAHPAIVEAVQKAAELGTSFGTPHRFEIELARLVREAVPSIERVRFVNSGTEATMSAVRLARGFTDREKIIKFDGCYHGHADFLLVAAGSGLATFGTPDSAGVTVGNARDTLVVPFNRIDLLASVIEQHGKDIAAVIMEPLPCNYGMISPAQGFLQTVRRLCDAHGIVLIFDEVISGFRLCRGGAQEYYGVQPDVTTLGKIIGGGLPVGAYGGRADIMALVAPDGPVYQAGTLAGNPLAMAAGIAALERLTPDVYAALRSKTALLRELLEPCLHAFRNKVLFSHTESIFTLCFTPASGITGLDDIKACDMQCYARFHREMLVRGVYLAPSGYEVAFLSLAHTDDDIKHIAQAAEEALAVVLA